MTLQPLNLQWPNCALAWYSWLSRNRVKPTHFQDCRLRCQAAGAEAAAVPLTLEHAPHGESQSGSALRQQESDPAAST